MTQSSLLRIPYIALSLMCCFVLAAGAAYMQKTHKNKSQSAERGLDRVEAPEKTAKVAQKGSPAEKAELLIQNGHSGHVLAVALSRDGKLLATGGEDNVIKLWDATTGLLIRDIEGHTDFVRHIAFSPNNTRMASAGNDRSVKVWDVANGKLIHNMQFHSDLVTSVAFSPDGRLIASGSHDGTIKLWDAAGGKLIDTLAPESESESDRINTVAFSPDGRLIASGGYDKKIRLWDVRSRSEVRTFGQQGEAINCVAFGPDSSKIASCSNDKTIKVWDVSTGQMIASLVGHTDAVRDIAFGRDGNIIVSAGKDRTIRIWNLSSKSASTLQGHSAEITAVALSLDGQTIASASRDNTAKLWDMASGKVRFSLESHSFAIISVAFSHDSQTIASASRDGAIQLWDAGTGRLLRAVGDHTHEVAAIALSPDGKTVASGGLDGTVKLWDAGSGQLLQTLKGHTQMVTAVAFNPDGKSVASGSADHTIRLWNAGSGKQIRDFKGHTSQVAAVAFSPDGKRIASGGWDNVGMIWDAGNGKLLRRLEGHTELINSVAFSPDSLNVASASDDKSVRIWDAASGQLIRMIGPQADRVRAVAFSLDGSTLASGGYDNTIKLWRAGTGEMIASLEGHSARVSSLAFSPNGKALLSGSWDTTTKLWSLASTRLLATLLPFKDENWVAYNPAGYYTGSEKALRYVSWRMGNRVYNFDQFFERFFRPDVIGEVFQTQDKAEAAPVESIEAPYSILPGIAPPPEAIIVSPKGDETISGSEVEVVVQAKDLGGGVSEIRFMHNEKVITGDPMVQLKSLEPQTNKAARGKKGVAAGSRRGKPPAAGAQSSAGAGAKNRGIEYVAGQLPTYIAKYRVALLEGDNVFKAIAFSKDRTESHPFELTVKASLQGQSSALHVLVVGINRYKNSALDLNYAASDARDVAKYFKGKGRGLFPQTSIIELYDDQATRANILNQFQALKDKARPEDVVVIYFAGHGDSVGEEWYFVPHDCVRPYVKEELSAGGLSASLISQELSHTQSRKVVVLLDACKAGTAEAAFRGYEHDKALSELARASGIYILAASTKDQQAAEVKELGHGIFTYLVLKGLNGDAAISGTRRVSVASLIAYVNSKMPDISRQYKTREQYPISHGTGMDFPLAVLN
jgi:WD40 repeat protein